MLSLAHKSEKALLVQDGILDRLGTVEAAKGKNVVIYIHGRSSDPLRPEEFVAKGDVWAKNWEAKNWAVYGFLWSKWSYSDSLPPNIPERRVWQNSNGDPKGVGYLAALTIKKEYTAWRAQGFDGELRIVGHSLGSQVASIVANHMVESTDIGARLRLELIDPYVPDGGFGAGAIEDSAAGNTAEYRAAIRETVKQNLANVAQKANPVVIYAATWVAAYASSLKEKAHWQEMDAAWMSQLGSGVVETTTLQHSAIRDAYFDSIQEPVPLTDYGAWAFSAALPTEELKKRPSPLACASETTTSS